MSTSLLLPHHHQIEISHFVANTPRCNIWAGMGTGKTAAILNVLAADYRYCRYDQPTLVIAPLRVANKTWPDEVRRWAQFAGLTLVSITGTPEERLVALRTKADIYTVNYENLPWLAKIVGERWPFRRVIADESTKLRGFRLVGGGERAGVFRKIAHRKIDQWVNLTGTPAPNGLNGLWGQQWFIDRGQRLGTTFEAFHQRWFSPTPRENGRIVWDPTSFAQEQIEDRLRDVTISIVNPLGVDKPIRNPLWIELPPSIRRKYEEMEDDFYTEIESTGIEALSSAARSQKLFQMASGAVYLDGGKEWVEVHKLLLDALEDVIEDCNGAPLLVGYQWKHDLRRILKRFPFARFLDDKPQTQDEWNEGRITLLVTHPASAGHGLNLQHGGNKLAFFGTWWDLELHDQLIERIGPTRQKQSGYDRDVTVNYLMAENTMHQMAYERLEHKRSIQDVLMEAMRKRK